MNAPGRQHRRSLLALSGIAISLIAVVIYMQARPHVDRLSAMEFLPIDLLGAVAVVDANVVSVEGLDRSQHLLVLHDVEVRWRAEEVRLVDGELHEVPPIPTGEPLVVRSWADHEYALGARYHLFLGNVFFPPEPEGSSWRSQFALRVDDQRPVEGVEPGTVAELRAILAPGEEPQSDTLQALLEFTIEQRAVLEARNAAEPEPPPGPRTARLEAFRDPPQPDPLEEWLALEPADRPLGPMSGDIPAGAAEELGVEWLDSMALVAHDAEDVDDGRIVIETPHGHGLAYPLTADRDATLLPLVRAKGSWVAIAVQESASGPRERLTGELTSVVPTLDAGGGLFIDLRGSGIEVEALPSEEFDELVLELRP